MMGRGLLFLFFILYSTNSFSGIKADKKNLSSELSAIRGKIIRVEKGLINTLKTQNKTKEQLKTIQSLLELQKQERTLSQTRLTQLEDFIAELESRRTTLKKKIEEQKLAIYGSLVGIHQTLRQRPLVIGQPVELMNESPKRELLSKIVDRRVKEIEILKIDLVDADELESKIQREKNQLVYVFQDLKEQESLLSFHKKLQEDVLDRQSAERIVQLESYQELKSSEQEVESLIQTFNARAELKKAEAIERETTKAIVLGDFEKLKGKLPFPVVGKIQSSFGRSYDQKTGLNIFKKGIEIQTEVNADVKSIAAGKVVYSGQLAQYGKVVILDHGEHYYSLYAHLGEIDARVGEWMKYGEKLGKIDTTGIPLYFEIRSHNVAVNPLQWLDNSIIF